MKSNFHHVAFTVKDIEESVQWYQENLGFTSLDTYQKDTWRIARIQSGEIIIELFNFKEATLPLPSYRNELIDDLHVIGTKHIAIEVEDLNKMIQDLKEKNVEIVGEVDTAYFGGTWIFIKDCDGILIELYQK